MTLFQPKSHISHFCGSTVRVWSVLWHLAMSVSSSDERSGSLKIVGSVRGMVRMGGFLLPMCWWWWSQAFYCYPTSYFRRPNLTFAEFSDVWDILGLNTQRTHGKWWLLGMQFLRSDKACCMSLWKGGILNIYVYVSHPIFPLTKCPTVSLTFKHDVYFLHPFFCAIFVSSRQGET